MKKYILDTFILIHLTLLIKKSKAKRKTRGRVPIIVPIVQSKQNEKEAYDKSETNTPSI